MTRVVAGVVHFVVTELNYLWKEGENTFDYKDRFKAEAGVRLIRDEVMKAYEKDKYQGRAPEVRLPI